MKCLPPADYSISEQPIPLKAYVKFCEQRRKFPVLYRLEFQVSSGRAPRPTAALVFSCFLPSRSPARLSSTPADTPPRRPTWRRTRIRGAFPVSCSLPPSLRFEPAPCTRVAREPKRRDARHVEIIKVTVEETKKKKRRQKKLKIIKKKLNVEIRRKNGRTREIRMWQPGKSVKGKKVKVSRLKKRRMTQRLGATLVQARRCPLAKI